MYLVIYVHMDIAEQNIIDIDPQLLLFGMITLTGILCSGAVCIWRQSLLAAKEQESKPYGFLTGIYSVTTDTVWYICTTWPLLCWSSQIEAKAEYIYLCLLFLSLAIDICSACCPFCFFLFQKKKIKNKYFDIHENIDQGSILGFVHLPYPRQHDKPLPLIPIPKLLSVLCFLLLSPGAHG